MLSLVYYKTKLKIKIYGYHVEINRKLYIKDGLVIQKSVEDLNGIIDIEGDKELLKYTDVVGYIFKKEPLKR